MIIRLPGPSHGRQVSHNSQKHIIHQRWLINNTVVIWPKFWFLLHFFIHLTLKNIKIFYFLYCFCFLFIFFFFFLTAWLQLKFTKLTFSLPPHQVLRDKKQCMTRLEWLHPAKANTHSYGNDWGVVFNKRCITKESLQTWKTSSLALCLLFFPEKPFSIKWQRIPGGSWRDLAWLL